MKCGRAMWLGIKTMRVKSRKFELFGGRVSIEIALMRGGLAIRGRVLHGAIKEDIITYYLLLSPVLPYVCMIRLIHVREHEYTYRRALIFYRKGFPQLGLWKITTHKTCQKTPPARPIRVCFFATPSNEADPSLFGVRGTLIFDHSQKRDFSSKKPNPSKPEMFFGRTVFACFASGTFYPTALGGL